MTLEEFIHVTFDESNPLSVEVDVVERASILKKTSLEDDDQDKYQYQCQEEDQILNEETRAEESNLENQNLPKE